MRKEIMEVGKTVDAAINAACEKLGCDREDCEWEILDLPKKTFLGLKTIPARVKVSATLPDQAPAVARPERKPAPQPVREERPPQKARQEKKREQPYPKKSEPVKRESKPAETIRPRPAETEREQEPEQPRILVTEGFTEKETTAMAYLSSVLGEFGLETELRLSREGSSVCIDVTGDGLGSIIGRRGETLDAIQYLTGLVANRLEGDYLRITVDCGEYRTKRKDTLEALAKKLADQVLKTNISKTLEPMNPFERRVIHATISKIEGVSSSSIGEEPNRRVIITTPTARRPSFRSERGGRDREYGERSGRDREYGERSGRDRDRGDRGGRGGHDRDRRRPSSPRGGSRSSSAPVPSGPPKETPESAAMSGTPMGKLDLE